MPGVILSRDAFDRTRTAVRWVETVNRSRPRASRRRSVPVTAAVVEGFLDGALAASTGNGTTEATATLSLFGGSGANWGDTGRNVTVTNRSDSLSGASGAFVIAIKVSGEWRPIWIDCDSTNEVQTITITGSPTGGTFPLTYQGQTATIDFDYTAAEVQTDLEALSSIGSGNVSCSGGPLPGTAVAVEFQGDLANTNVNKLLTNSASLTGGTSPEVNVEVDTEGCCG